MMRGLDRHGLGSVFPRLARGLALLGMIVAVGLSNTAWAESINAGGRPANPSVPFDRAEVARFDYPWAIAFLPDGRLLVTEKPGRIFLVTPKGAKTEITGIPAVHYSGQDGLLDVEPAPDFSTSRRIYFTFVEPGTGGGRLALARARLREAAEAGQPAGSGAAHVEAVAVLWRAEPSGGGGQPGGIIAFSPDGHHLFLSSGDRMRPMTAQDLGDSRGKIIRLDLDGTAPPDNPFSGRAGARPEIWTVGHRNPYGLAFAADGTLFEHEMGPRGGDEFNRIEKGRNYGWPLVSNGINYDGTPIPPHASRPEFVAPPLYWTPVIAPAGMSFYEGNLFAGWRGSVLIGGLQSRGLVRVAFRPDGQPYEADRFDLGHRIRDVAVAADGAIWIIEDEEDGRLLRLTPKG